MNQSNNLIDFKDIIDLNADDLDFSNIQDNFCRKCNKKDIMEDNLCGNCFYGVKRCSSCNIYFTMNNEEEHCSDCILCVKFKDQNLSIDQILNLPDCEFKRKLIEDNLENLFEIFVKETKINHKLLKNPAEFKILLNLCKNKTSGEIYAILNGYREFFPCFLPAKFADELITQSIENIKDDEKGQFVHAIAPFIFNIWNIYTRISLLDCYYRDFGDLNKCPKNYQKLYTLWYRAIKSPFRKDLTRTVLCKCKLCYCAIFTNESLTKCLSCHGFLHINCCLNFIELNLDNGILCPICNGKWTIENNSITDYGGFLIV